MGKIKLAERSALARNIVTRRKAKGWKQPDLAHKVGVHLNTIKSIENDKSEGEKETREAIAGALGCTVSELYMDDKPKMSDLTKPDKIMSMLEKMADEKDEVERLKKENAELKARLAELPPKAWKTPIWDEFEEKFAKLPQDEMALVMLIVQKDRRYGKNLTLAGVTKLLSRLLPASRKKIPS